MVMVFHRILLPECGLMRLIARVCTFFTFCEKLLVYRIYRVQINTKVQCHNFFSKIFSSSYSGGQLKILGGVKNEKILYLEMYTS